MNGERKMSIDATEDVVRSPPHQKVFMRRKSSFMGLNGSVTGTGSGRRGSFMEETEVDKFTRSAMSKAPRPKMFENTYRMEPPRKFPYDVVVQIISETLEKYLKGKDYEYKFAIEITKTISEEIKDAVKDLHVDRYRVLSLVYVGSTPTDARVFSRCLWQEKFDSAASASFKSKSLFAVGIAFGVYYE
eukprot:m.6759 g.6759  ORF g.6759 m.6759 type:complete len:188 (+) comp16809_c0_seq1:96-659(+)